MYSKQKRIQRKNTQKNKTFEKREKELLKVVTYTKLKKKEDELKKLAMEDQNNSDSNDDEPKKTNQLPGQNLAPNNMMGFPQYQPIMVSPYMPGMYPFYNPMMAQNMYPYMMPRNPSQPQ